MFCGSLYVLATEANWTSRAHDSDSQWAGDPVWSLESEPGDLSIVYGSGRVAEWRKDPSASLSLSQSILVRVWREKDIWFSCMLKYRDFSVCGCVCFTVWMWGLESEGNGVRLSVCVVLCGKTNNGLDSALLSPFLPLPSPPSPHAGATPSN